jgi:hypothetical protein
LNIALTGVMSTYGASPDTPYQSRDSWLGGRQGSVAGPSDTMLLMEGPFNPVVPAMMVLNGSTSTQVFPMAMREYWTGWFYPTTVLSMGCQGPTGSPSVAMAPFSGKVPVTYADGHTKTVSVEEILANTPYAAQIGQAPKCGGYPHASSNLGFSLVTTLGTPTAPAWTQPWPFWGLQ